MRRRIAKHGGREDPMGLFMDPIMDFIGLMFFMVIFLLIAMKTTVTPTKLRFLPVNPPRCILEVPYLFTVPLQGGLGDRTFTDPEETLAGLGLNLDPRSGTVYGVVRGVPHGERHDIRVHVVDQKGDSEVAKFELEVGIGSLPITRKDTELRLLHESGILPDARAGAPYEAVIGAHQGLGRIRWTMLGHPSGFDLENGRLSGQCDHAGRYELTVAAEFDGGHPFVGADALDWMAREDRRTYLLRVLPKVEVRKDLSCARVGEAWSADLLSGGLRPGELLRFEGLPDGVVPAGDGRVVGTPTKEGTYEVGVELSIADRRLQSETTTIRVLPTRPAPEGPRGVIMGRVDEALQLMLPYRGLVEPVLASSENLPPGLKLTGLTVGGIPEEAGRTHFSVSLTDAVGMRLESTLTLEIAPARKPLQIVAPREIWVPMGGAHSWPLTTSGGGAPGGVDLEGSPPPGVELRNGLLTCRLAAVDPIPLSVKCVDSLTQELATATVVLKGIWAESKPLRIATGSLPTALVGDDYCVTLAATDSAGATTWELVEGAPMWSLASEGVLSGRPLAEGRSRLVVIARDAAGRRTEPTTFDLIAERPERSAPVVTTTSLPAATVGRPYAFTFAAEGGLGRLSWKIEGVLPKGLFLEGPTLRGTPEDSETHLHHLTLEVADERGALSGRRELDLRLLPIPATPRLAILTRKLPPALVGNEYAATLAAAGGLGPVHWTAEGLPAGLSLESGHITGMPREPGARIIRVTATDAEGSAAGPLTLEWSAIDVALAPATSSPKITPWSTLSGLAGILVGALAGAMLARKSRSKTRP